jgi:zinc D-Ala-D-Ala carboxypeptidase
MTLLSTHFTLEEMIASQTAAREGIDNTPTPEIIEALKYTAQGLEGVRILLGVPILVSSGYRCLALNRAIGSKDTSQHVKGEAVDFTAPGFGGPTTVMTRILESGLDYDQCILEYASKPGRGWVHMSFTRKPRHQALVIDDTGTRPWSA